MNKSVRIKYTPIAKRAYTTQETGIEFSITINGISAKGYWIPSHGRYVSGGVDINDLRANDRSIIPIFDGGGNRRTYEISAHLEKALKQPKDMSFTGPTLSIDNLKGIFVNKIKNAILNPNSEPKLSAKFLEYFNLNNNKSESKLRKLIQTEIKKVLKENSDTSIVKDMLPDEYQEYVDTTSIVKDEAGESLSYEFDLYIPKDRYELSNSTEALRYFKDELNYSPGVEGNPGGQVSSMSCYFDKNKQTKTDWVLSVSYTSKFDI